jgi:hypothetical protein
VKYLNCSCPKDYIKTAEISAEEHNIHLCPLNRLGLIPDHTPVS